MPGRLQLRFPCWLGHSPVTEQHSPGPLGVPGCPSLPFPPTARSERYRHLGSEDDETNDEESSTEIPQFSSCSHRFSKVGWPVAMLLSPSACAG